MTTRELAQIVEDYRNCPAERADGWLVRRLERVSRCPVSRYLLACRCFDQGRPAVAVRHMMVAHHAEPQLESAGLLVFAGLNWVSRRSSPLLSVLLATWEEFRRPQFDRHRRERLLLDALAEPAEGLERVSELARRLWRVPIATLRRQLRAAVESRDEMRYSVLLTPA